MKFIKNLIKIKYKNKIKNQIQYLDLISFYGINEDKTKYKRSNKDVTLQQKL